MAAGEGCWWTRRSVAVSERNSQGFGFEQL